MNHTHFQTTHNPFCFLLLLCYWLLTPLSAWAAVLAYVPNSTGNTVSVIDTTDNSLLTTVTVGLNPADAAITPDGKWVYVTNYNDGTVSVIDTSNNTVLTTISVGINPSGVAATNTKVYVALTGNDAVAIINTSNHSVSILDVGNQPQSIAITPDGSKVYVANFTSNNVSVIQTSNDTVIGSPIPVGSFAMGVVATNSKVYVTIGTGRLKIIDTSSNTVVATKTVRTSPYTVTVTPSGSSVYVANYGDNSVSVMRTSDNTVIKTVSVGYSPSGIAVTPDGKKVYVINSGDDTISVIDTTTNTVMPGTPFLVGDSPNIISNVPSALGRFIGQVSAPRYSSTPAPTNTITLPSTTVSVASTTNLDVRETGEATLKITSITVTDPTTFTVSPTSFDIGDGGASQPVTIQCNSSTAGTYTATLNVVHNATGSPATYPLSCTVNAAPTPGYSSLPVAGGTLSFIATAPTNPAAQTLTIQENGNAQLDVTLAIAGTDSGKFTVSPALSSTFSIGDGVADKVFSIHCDGSTVGTYTATLTATHNAAGSPATYNLSCSVGATPTASYTSTPVAGTGFDFTTTAFTNASPQTLTVQNSGTATLNVTSITTTGADNAKFTVTPTNLTVNSGGGTQTVTISCDGSTAGTYTALLTVTHDAGSAASYPLSCVVDKLDTTITLDSHDPDPSATGQTVTFFFTVDTTTGTATGTVKVKVKDDTTILCTGTLATDGTGNCTHPFTSPGDYLVTAEYVASTNYNGSLSSDVTHPVINGSILFSTNTTDLLEGQEDAYTIELPTHPTSPIEITLKADAQTELSLDGIDYAPTQILSLTDITPQTVYVRAIDDTLKEGNHSGKITHTITQSTDTGYPTALKIPAVTVNITDNEAGVVITPTSLTVIEGKIATYVVKLASQPLNDVTITVTPGNNQVQVTPTSLTFLSDVSALDPQTITVTAIDDQTVEGTHQTTLKHIMAVGDGGDYSDILPLDAVKVNITDNESLAPPSSPPPSDNQNTDTGNGSPPDNTPPRPIATLFVTVDGDDKGRVESNQGGISCSNYGMGTCQATYPPGTEITLTPIADPGFKFSSWGGHLDCTDNKVLLMADNKLCVAFFAPLPSPPAPAAVIEETSVIPPASPPPSVPETPTVTENPVTAESDPLPTETTPVETTPVTPAPIETVSPPVSSPNDPIPPASVSEETVSSSQPPAETVPPVSTPVTEDITSPPVITPVETSPAVSIVWPPQPIVVYPTGEGWCPPKDWLDWVCNAQWRTLHSDLDIEVGGQLSNAILEGEVHNQGWVYNLIIQPQSTVSGGVVSGYITNHGKLSDFEFRGYSIEGGTLSGTIFNNSSVGGYFQDVQLAPHTHIIGGRLKGQITGDIDAPALLENLQVQAGSHLTGVILGKGVKVSKQVTLDEDVRIEMTDK